MPHPAPRPGPRPEPPPALALPALSLPGALQPALPLRGLTVLAVEDSRFACEALRLICQRTGARLRRAETLAAARAHLRTYRPDLAVIDLGLPDGSGLSLIAELALSRHRPEAVLAISGDPAGRDAAFDAGADGFLEKPLESVAGFLTLLRGLLPDRALPAVPPGRDEALCPDPLALQDDLGRLALLLEGEGPPDAYVAGFARGLAGQLHDAALAEAARGARFGPAGHLARLRGLVETRRTAPADAFAARGD